MTKFWKFETYKKKKRTQSIFLVCRVEYLLMRDSKGWSGPEPNTPFSVHLPNTLVHVTAVPARGGIPASHAACALSLSQ